MSGQCASRRPHHPSWLARPMTTFKGGGGALAVLFVLLANGCSSQHNANQELRRKLEDLEIRRVVIFAIPRDVERPVGATAESIEQRYDIRLELRAGAIVPEVKGLDRALVSTDCKPLAQAGDVRTAIVFYDINNVKVTGFYYGSDPTSPGQIDQRPCQLGPGLLNWAHGLLSHDVLP